MLIFQVNIVFQTFDNEKKKKFSVINTDKKFCNNVFTFKGPQSNEQNHRFSVLPLARLLLLGVFVSGYFSNNEQ